MNTLTFNEVNFNPIERNGQIWLTSAELAKALGYSDHTGVNRTFNRNKDEFTKNMTQLIKINEKVISTSSAKTKGLVAKTRIFSLRGCYAIAMFSRTDIAKKFRKWVLDILERESGQPVQVSTLSTVADRKPLVAAVNEFCGKTGAIYSDVWKMVHQRFGLISVNEMTVEQVPQAVDYMHGLLVQVQYGGINIEKAMDNEMWRYVGILKHFDLSKALDNARRAADDLYQAIGVAQSHTGLIYDAFGEQRKLTNLGEGGSQTALSQAKAFIERQDARKQNWQVR